MCFSMDWLLRILILAIVVGGVIQILRLIVPFALRKLGSEVGEGANLLMEICRISFWVVVTIVIVVIAFQVIACLWQMAGGGGLLLPHGR